MSQTIIEPFSSRLRKAMGLRSMKGADLVKATGLSKQQISQYVNGKFEPKPQALYSLAQALNVPEKWLSGFDVPMDREAPVYPSGVLPLKIVSLPVLGEIACGAPLLTFETGESYQTMVAMDGEPQADFCLRAKGDSMMGAGINDGDMVLVRSQERVETGEIAAVIIDDEATLKRVHYDEERGELSLYPENPAYRPMHYKNEDLEKIRILGKAISVHSKL